jgi:hypothetical protein
MCVRTAPFPVTVDEPPLAECASPWPAVDVVSDVPRSRGVDLVVPDGGTVAEEPVVCLSIFGRSEYEADVITRTRFLRPR